jgi:hypothetical protein
MKINTLASSHKLMAMTILLSWMLIETCIWQLSFDAGRRMDDYATFSKQNGHLSSTTTLLTVWRINSATYNDKWAAHSPCRNANDKLPVRNKIQYTRNTAHYRDWLHCSLPACRWSIIMPHTRRHLQSSNQARWLAVTCEPVAWRRLLSTNSYDDELAITQRALDTCFKSLPLSHRAVTARCREAAAQPSPRPSILRV